MKSLVSGLTEWTRTVSGEVDFTTFMAKVKEPFTPALNEEADLFVWGAAERGSVLLCGDRHAESEGGAGSGYAFRTAGGRLSDGISRSAAPRSGHRAAPLRFPPETHVARAVQSGELASPSGSSAELGLFQDQDFPGPASPYRPALKKNTCWRDAKIYLVPEFIPGAFLALPVIWMRQKGLALDTENLLIASVGVGRCGHGSRPKASGPIRPHSWTPVRPVPMANASYRRRGRWWSSRIPARTTSIFPRRQPHTLLVEGNVRNFSGPVAICPEGVWDKQNGPGYRYHRRRACIADTTSTTPADPEGSRLRWPTREEEDGGRPRTRAPRTRRPMPARPSWMPSTACAMT